MISVLSFTEKKDDINDWRGKVISEDKDSVLGVDKDG